MTTEIDPAPYAHPADEACPPGCPTLLAEIADYVTEWASAYTSEIKLTADDVARALAKPQHSYRPQQMEWRIHDIAKNWV